jgi:Caspase domain.
MRRPFLLRKTPLLMVILSACISLTCRKHQQPPVANKSMPAMRFALQVGIDDYEYVNKLNGCVQDILDMKEVLVQRFGFPQENILSLTNKQATHEAIIEAFKAHLIDNAKRHPNTFVIFQYSGHGSQADDGNGDESDGLDETIIQSPDAGSFSFDNGDHFKFNIENTSGNDMYVTLFDLGTEGSIQILYPPEGTGDLVKNGNAITLQPVFVVTGASGTETFKVVGTTSPTNFNFLTQKAVGRDADSPLELLIGALIGGTRAGIVKSTPVDDWASAQINFVIGRNKGH